MAKKRKQIILTRFFLIFLLGCVVFSGCQSAKKRENPESLIAEGWVPQEWGYVLMDPETNQILEEKSSSQLFIPSSLNKVIPNYAALKILGAEHRFTTALLYVGEIKKKKLIGDLYLKGGGDPFFTASDLMNFVEKIKKSGLTRVHGHFYYDESRFSSQESIDVERDELSHFNAGVSALSSEFNQISFAGGCFDPTVRAATKNPGLMTALLLKKIAQMQGVSLPDPESKKTPSHAKTLISYLSLPLWELAGKSLEYSNNLMAELMLFEVGLRLNPAATNLESASLAVKKWLKKSVLLQESMWQGFELANGSGLGMKNQVSPLQMAYILQAADRWQDMNHSFISLLPALGWKGTLDRRHRNVQMVLRAWAKTGTQSYSSTLGGYLLSASGKKLIFVMMASDLGARLQAEQKMVLPAREGFPALRSHEWMDLAKTLQDQLLVQWVEKY